MKFRGFTNNFRYNFVRMVFKNTNAMRNAINLFQNKTWDSYTKKITKITPKKVYIRGITKQAIVYDLYENMIDPMIRFIHHREIKPVGWITIKKNCYNMRNYCLTNCKYNIETRWTNIKYNKCEHNVKLKVLAYDIECDSSHGDFPLPIKDYIKLSRELVLEFEKMQKAEHRQTSNKSIYSSYIQDRKKFVKDSLYAAFNNGNEEINISKVYTKNNAVPSKKTIDLVATKISNLLVNYNPHIKATDRNKLRNKSIEEINVIMWDKNNQGAGYFPEVEGDKTIQIGCSFVKYGELKPYRNVIYTLGSCKSVKDVEVKCFQSEARLLLAFCKLINQEDPDIITGYNIIGFDTPWLIKRASELDILDTFSKLSKLDNYTCTLYKKSQKSAIGQLITIESLNIPGRIQLDIMKLVQKGYNFTSYKLDNVAANFIRGDIISTEYTDQQSIIHTNNVRGLNIGNFIIFIEKSGYLEDKYLEGKKFEIIGLDNNKIFIKDPIQLRFDTYKCYWCLGKDDVSPKDIFRLQKGDSHDRSIIAKYCMMDVILCIELLIKLELITNCICMANVCLIPLNWSIHRGQGVKILSLVSNRLRKENFLLPYIYKSLLNKDGYEGAIVLPPKPGLYLNDPIAVLDYASLYPSSIIMGNLSHETVCEDDRWLGDNGIEELKMLGYSHYDVTYDVYETIFTPSGSVKAKRKIGQKTVRYAQYPDNKKGIIPKTLQHLLNARKSTRKKIKYKTVIMKNKDQYIGLVSNIDDKIILITENGTKKTLFQKDIEEMKDTYNQFQKNVLDGLQLAFKITANSLYGQIGARVSDLYYREIAASTTSIGRTQLYIAQKYCENPKNFIKTLNNGTQLPLKNEVIYGDTDSVFVKFDCRDCNGNKLTGKPALAETIKLAQQAEHGINKILMKPQDIEYEKTFWPFILITKKRYVGNKYEHDLNKYKQTSMGIVLKRRDNAQIVKIIFGGIIDIIMKDQNIISSINFLRKSLLQLIKGKFKLDTLIISKTLSSFYKDPDRIAHKVLADRIGEREPGNKPKINDRIPYIYIETKKSHSKIKLLQGDKIETPDYIKEHGLSPNYEFYITNQIMKPVSQIYGLCLEKIPGYKPNQDYNKLLEKYVNSGKTRTEAFKKMLEKKQQHAGKLLFSDILRTLDNKKRGYNEITKWFGKKSTKSSNIIKEITVNDYNEFESDSSDNEISCY